MRIPHSYVEALTQSLNNLSEATKRAFIAQLESIEYDSIADLREKVLEILQPLLEVATDYAASYAATAYDLIRYSVLGDIYNAAAVSERDPNATDGAVHALVTKVDKSGFSVFQNLLLERIDYEIKRAAADCTFYNGRRDPAKPRYARVPTGTETCPFCIMLASRGFVYHSKESAGSLNHFHANCDCRVIPGFKGMEVDGYNPKKYYDQYVADLKSGKLKLNTVTKDSSHVLTWSSEQFNSAGDFTKFIFAAKDIEDLQQRCAVVEQEFPKTGLPDRYYQNLESAVNEMKNKLIRTVA